MAHKLSIQKTILQYILIALSSLLWVSCANVVPPTGGAKDETPPKLTEISPADSSLNLKPKKITLRFDKYMEVQNLATQMHLSPIISINPTVISYGKRVEIKIIDSLLTPNTTYLLSLGNALVDNREYTPYANFTYIFSTGDYFDSLQLIGAVIDAQTGLPDTAATIVLYDADMKDSAIFRDKPKYVTKTNSKGQYNFGLLPHKNFKIFALYDKENNYIFEPKDDKIGFIEKMVIPEYANDSIKIDSIATIYTFKEEQAIDSTATSTTQESLSTGGRSGARTAPSKAAAKDDLGYVVKVDTFNKEKRTFELTEDLTINLYKVLGNIDSSKIYLSYEQNEIEIEAPHKLSGDTAQLKINTKWVPDKVYTLRLIKGWATDTSGIELPPGKYIFRTKQDEDYAKWRINLDSEYYGADYVLFVYKETDTIHLKPITDTTVTLSLLQPGNYDMRIIIDENKDGKWTTGNYLEKRQPEKVIPYFGQITLKAGWENETDYKAPKKANDTIKEEERQ